MGSQIVDYEGRLLAAASPGPGKRIVNAPIDFSALRHERASRRGHHRLAGTEAYPLYHQHQYPPIMKGDTKISYGRNNGLIDEAKRRLNELEVFE